MPEAQPRFDFSTLIDRASVPGEKWGRYAGRDVLPLWVADMDFAAPPVVLEALQARLEHGVFGYTEAWPSLEAAVVDAMWRDYRWTIQPDWLVWLPGVVTGFNLACRLVDPPEAGVVSATPVYPPFLSAPANSGHRLQACELQFDGRRWNLDFDRLAACIDRSSRLLMLCNPHNPVGRAFDRGELAQLARLAEQHDLLICSDEIHCGLILDPDIPHLPIATLDASVARRTITLMAPSKTWNIPGLHCAFAIIPEATLRRRFRHAMRGIVPQVNVLGLVAAEAAYRDGEPWRQALIEQLRLNRDKVCEAIAGIPEIEMARPEATYLAWLDCRRWLAERGLESACPSLEEGGVGLSDGAPFGSPGFVRLNFACPQATLGNALDRIVRVFRRERP